MRGVEVAIQEEFTSLGVRYKPPFNLNLLAYLQKFMIAPIRRIFVPKAGNFLSLQRLLEAGSHLSRMDSNRKQRKWAACKKRAQNDLLQGKLSTLMKFS